MKTKAFVKTLFTLAVIAVFALAFALAACEDMFGFPGQNKEEVEYLDWQYIEEPDGGGQLTLMLDGTTPFAHARPNQRALSLALAKMSHDYFEVVFKNGDHISRAAWEIGMPAGIAGVRRDVDYAPVTSTTNASVIFVGKKTGKTLLGIGQLVKVDETVVSGGGSTGTVLQASKSVTFGVYPLITAIGISTPGTLRLPETFLQNFGTGTPNNAATVDNCQNIALQVGATYPLFKLPEVPNTLTTTQSILASYMISNIIGTTAGTTFGAITVAKQNFAPVCILAASLEIIKRTPSFLYKGQIYDAVGEVIDMYTEVTHTNNTTSGVAIQIPFTMTFTQERRSTGIFAITFQVPVYAMTLDPVLAGVPANSSNGGPPATKWYIRPGYNQYQYLLDDGEAAGGAVMLGSGVAGLDWLDIFTVGIGFSN